MRLKRTPTALVLPAALFLAIPVGIALGPIAGVATVGLGMMIAGRTTPRFWPNLIVSVAAGGLAGAVILGPGFRIAMRIVAVLEPSRVTEFTIEGTMFIIVFIGALIGSVLGLVAHFIRMGFGLGRSGVAIVTAVLAIGFIVVDSETRLELFQLGLGFWFNAPMFGLIAATYGYASCQILDRAMLHFAPAFEKVEVSL
jgi:hypothetical protein